MKYHYTFLVLITLFISCKGSKPKSSVSEVKPQMDTLEEILKKGAKDLAERESHPIERSVKDSAFKVFFNAFKKALKSKNRIKVLTFIHFPIRGLYHCYLTADSSNINPDTIGVHQKRFLSIYKKVFDKEALFILDAPADSLYVYSDNDGRDYHLQRFVDVKTPIYDYPIFYEYHRGGLKSFFFGKINGAYKLSWIGCQGCVEPEPNEQ